MLPCEVHLDRGLISGIVRTAVERCITSSGLSRIPNSPAELFNSSQANSIKAEIIRAGRKLWTRQYVDGSGGNISARISPEYVISTPTMLSKGDLRVEDLSLVDLENRQIVGARPQTSEILLHLEIYKAVPDARAVIHCHPPYATAHAVAGIVPQGNLVSEQELFIGPVALAAYETPGTMAFAKAVLPLVRGHNTILLSNHGLVCWADSVTHAEWYTEVVETYCKTLVIAKQLRPDLIEIPSSKITDLLTLKKRLGLPDPRLPVDESPVPASAEIVALESGYVFPHDVSDFEIELLVSRLSGEIVQFLEEQA